MAAHRRPVDELGRIRLLAVLLAHGEGAMKARPAVDVHVLQEQLAGRGEVGFELIAGREKGVFHLGRHQFLVEAAQASSAQLVEIEPDVADLRGGLPANGALGGRLQPSQGHRSRDQAAIPEAKILVRHVDAHQGYRLDPPGGWLGGLLVPGHIAARGIHLHFIATRRQSAEAVVTVAARSGRPDHKALSAEDSVEREGCSLHQGFQGLVLDPILVLVFEDRAGDAQATAADVAEVRGDVGLARSESHSIRIDLAVVVRSWGAGGGGHARQNSAVIGDLDEVAFGGQAVELVLAVGIGRGTLDEVVDSGSDDAVTVHIEPEVDGHPGEARLTGVPEAVAVGI